MHLYTTLPNNDVIRRLSTGRLGSWQFNGLRQAYSSKHTGEWPHGVFCIETPSQEDLLDLQDDLALPATFQTRIWFNCQPAYEGQTDVYAATAAALKEWEGDLALLHDGDSVRVQRLGSQVSLRDDCLNPERLVFYHGLEWKSLPRDRREA